MADTDDPAASPPQTDPAPPYTSQAQDGSVIEQWDVPSRTYRRYECGTLVEERPFTDAENASADEALADEARRAAQAALLVQVHTDLADNQTYLDSVAAGTVTTDATAAQVAALTRQVQGYFRLTFGVALADQPSGD
ncbi:hypothetical protein [Streptomyces sp. NPDC051452]|uniref:hypothetical protein n=1 Tax=Streptomyces sp. NPDC051452 TaxID=3365654 RepID=UPI003787F145